MFNFKYLGNTLGLRRQSLTCCLGLFALIFQTEMALANSDAQRAMEQRNREQEQQQAPASSSANPMQAGNSAAGQAAYGQAHADTLTLDRTADTQREQQSVNALNNTSAGGSAGNLASQLMTTSVGLIAAGIAANAASKPCYCAGMPMIAMGIFFGKGSQGASNASNAMFDTSGYSTNLGTGLDNLGGADRNPAQNAALTNSRENALGIFAKNGVSTGDASSSSSFRADGRSEIQIDESALSQKAGDDLAQIEKSLGLPRGDLVKAITSGSDLAQFLADRNALFGKTADEFRAELAQAKIDEAELVESFTDGELAEYGGPEAGEAAGLGAEFAGRAGASSKGAGQNISVADAMAAIFGKKTGAGNPLLDAEKEKLKNGTSDLRALASRSDINLTADYGRGAIFSEASLFERVRQRYKAETPNLLTTDFLMRMQFGAKETKQ